MRALSIRQPYAELILRGIKTVELRSISTNIIGERFYIYASKTPASRPIWSEDLQVGRPPGWMIELAQQIKMIEPGALLPTGVIVGSAVIEKVTEVASGQLPVASYKPRDRDSLTTDHRPLTTMYEWHL